MTTSRCTISAATRSPAVRERFERDGRTAEIERVLVYTVRDGQLSECWVYEQDQAQVDAFLA
jgi:hypothetical protein